MVFYSPRVFTQVILHIFRQENWVTLRGPPDGVTQLLFSSIPPVFVLDGPLPCSQELTASYCSDEGDFSWISNFFFNIRLILSFFRLQGLRSCLLEGSVPYSCMHFYSLQCLPHASRNAYNRIFHIRVLSAILACTAFFGNFCASADPHLFRWRDVRHCLWFIVVILFSFTEVNHSFIRNERVGTSGEVYFRRWKFHLHYCRSPWIFRVLRCPIYLQKYQNL